ncbi:hypothetical protein IMZ48_40905 [Candidatus Bathyarchaeota archaeon]|nr:hypothetical protein [Candidatus Bathyarchaeota archaeon]
MHIFLVVMHKRAYSRRDVRSRRVLMVGIALELSSPPGAIPGVASSQ